jgi:hypothetical protein
MRFLFAVELRRLTARRLTRAIAAFVLLGIVAAGAIAFAISDRNIAGATERARAAATAEYQACLRGEFLSPHERTPGFDPASGCGLSALDEITADPRLHLSVFLDVARNLGPLAAILALIIGASFVGADWHHRVITTTLTWEPRRTRLLLAKVAAVAVASAAGTTVALALLGGALIPAAAFRGTTQGAGSAWLLDVAGVVGRVALFAGVASVMGAALATIGRNTTAAVGAVFVWLAVVENLIRGLRPGWLGFFFGENAGLMLGVSDVQLNRSGLAGGFVVVLYAAALVAAASAAFKRDVA